MGDVILHLLFIEGQQTIQIMAMENHLFNLSCFLCMLIDAVVNSLFIFKTSLHHWLLGYNHTNSMTTSHDHLVTYSPFYNLESITAAISGHYSPC